MMRRALILVATAASLALAAGRPVSAGFADFQYGTDVTPSPIGPTASVPAQGSLLNQSGVGSFVSPSGMIHNAAINGALGADITVGTLSVIDLGLGAYTDTYGPTVFTIDLALRDVDSNAVGLFTFSGVLSGQVASNGTTSASSIFNPFVATSQAETIGTTVYTVSIIPSKAYSAPGSPPSGGTGLSGTYTFNVTAATGSIPEPASVVMFGFGFGALGLLGMVRHRSRRLDL